MRLLLLLGIATILITLILSTERKTVSLQSGDYYAQGSMYLRSTLRVESNQESDRVCLSAVEGPASPDEGYETITVSSLFVRGGQIYRDGDELMLDRKKEGFTMGIGGRAMWEHRENVSRKLIPDEAALLKACLESTVPYNKTVQGRFINGMKFLK
jgi:hypothetical protein